METMTFADNLVMIQGLAQLGVAFGVFVATFLVTSVALRVSTFFRRRGRVASGTLVVPPPVISFISWRKMGGAS